VIGDAVDVAVLDISDIDIAIVGSTITMIRTNRSTRMMIIIITGRRSRRRRSRRSTSAENVTVDLGAICVESEKCQVTLQYYKCLATNKYTNREIRNTSIVTVQQSLSYKQYETQ
jgi:hypothetical protein